MGGDQLGREFGRKSEARLLTWRHRYGRDFMVVFPDALRGLARDKNGGPTALRVLVWCWDRLSWEKFEFLTQDDVGVDLNMSAAAVRKGLSRLLSEGLLERQGRGARQQWRNTPDASWRGGAERYNQVLTERAQAAAAQMGEEDWSDGAQTNTGGGGAGGAARVRGGRKTGGGRGARAGGRGAGHIG